MRRRWRVEEKPRIVIESYRSGATVAEIARRHEVTRGPIWTRRRQVRRGLPRARVTDDDPTIIEPCPFSGRVTPVRSPSRQAPRPCFSDDPRIGRPQRTNGTFL
jgi:transposase-like protein